MTMRCFAVLSVLVFSVLFSDALASAQLIDFESTPGGAIPTDDAFLSTPYPLGGTDSVRFFFDRNLNNTFDSGVDDLPTFEAAGDDLLDGWVNNGLSQGDIPAAGFAAQLGDYFLRPTQPGSVPSPFIIDYNTTLAISALSGEIWDIDGSVTATEQWQVDILDAANNVIATQNSPIGVDSTLDSTPWTFAFSGLPAGVDKARLTFIGTKISGVGLAFNNFSPFAIPEPSSALLIGSGLAWMAARRETRNRR